MLCFSSVIFTQIQFNVNVLFLECNEKNAPSYLPKIKISNKASSNIPVCYSMILKLNSFDFISY